MKVLFLDHDGVICLHNNWGSRFKNNTQFDDFNTDAINILNEIIEETDCEIVVSSDWRFHTTIKGLRELYREREIHKLPISTTPLSFIHNSPTTIEKNRAEEIMTWMGIRQWDDTDNWVAVDDLNLSPYIEEQHFVKTTDLFGITDMGKKEEIINKLNKVGWLNG